MHAVTDQQRCLTRVPLPGSNPYGFACLFVSNSRLASINIGINQGRLYLIAHSYPHYTLKKYAFYSKICILRIISSFLQVYFAYMNLSWLYKYLVTDTVMLVCQSLRRDLRELQELVDTMEPVKSWDEGQPSHVIATQYISTQVRGYATYRRIDIPTY